MKSLLISLCLLWAVTGQAANVAISGLPTVTALFPGDDILVNKTNTGLGTYTTKRINAANLVKSAIEQSNRVFQNLIFNPTNTYVPSGTTASGTVGTFLVTLTAGTTARPDGTPWHTGDNFVLNTVDQYRISKVIDTTHVNVFQQLITTYVNATMPLFSPCAVVINDDNGNPHAFIEGDGSYWVDTEQGGLANSGKIGLNAGTNSCAWDLTVDAFGWVRAGWEPTGVFNQGMPFSMSVGAPGDSARVLHDGQFDIERGLTNVNSAVLPVNTTLSYFVPAFATAAPTISGTIHGARLTASSSAFAPPVAPGYTLVIGSDVYVISKVVSATVVDVDTLLLNNYSGASFLLIQPHQIYNTITPSPAGFVAADGSLGMVGENLANQQTALHFSNDTNSFSARPHLETEGTRLEFGSEQNGGAPTFSYNEFAPGDSLHVEANGHVGISYGITNIHGSTIPVDLALVCASNVNATRFVATQVNISGSNIDWSLGDKFYKILSASTPFVFSNVADGEEPIIVAITDPSTFVVTWTGVVWPAGTPPTQTVSGHTDVYSFVRMNGTNYGSVVQNF